MVVMDKTLAHLVNIGIISSEEALEKCINEKELKRFITMG
jgi:Tfp pilus assembly pilus retraction ATPase PilT